MKAEKQYVKYFLVEDDFILRAKIGDRGITFQNKGKGKSHFWRDSGFRAAENVFVFKQSQPELIEKFAKAMKLAVKLSKEQEK